MKNLEELKKKFEEEYKCAETCNRLEERFGIEFLAYMHNGIMHVEPLCNDLPIGVAAKLLKAFKPTTEIALDATAVCNDGHTKGFYHMEVCRGCRDKESSLRVRWVCDNTSYFFRLPVDGNEVLEAFFHNGERPFSQYELDIYKPTRNGRLVKSLNIPIKLFNCSYIEYSGGYVSATDVKEIDAIIEAIKNA